MSIFESFALNFPKHLFTKCRDQTGFAKVMQCIGSVFWELQLEFVVWICDYICNLQDWIGGCSCHEDEFAAGIKVVCEEKGKRMETAFTHATEVLAEFLQGIANWTAARFNGDMSMAYATHACIRYAFALGTEKIGYLNTLPWLLARLEQPGVRALCVEQWASVDPSKHHPSSVKIMCPTKPIRADVDAIDEHGGGASSAVRLAIRHIKKICMDDSIGEGPHALAHREFLHGRRSQWPFIASSCRLSQNLRDVDDLVPAVGADLETEWRRHKTLIRLSRDKVGINSRMSMRAYSKAVYRMAHLLIDDASGEDVEAHGEGQSK